MEDEEQRSIDEEDADSVAGGAEYTAADREALAPAARGRGKPSGAGTFTAAVHQ